MSDVRPESDTDRRDVQSVSLASKSIRIRSARADDWVHIQTFLGDDRGGLDPNRDTVVLAQLGDAIVGTIGVRVLPVVHGLYVNPGSLRRKIVDGLYGYANGLLKARGAVDALAIVEAKNVAMRHYLMSNGAIEECGVIYTVNVE